MKFVKLTLAETTDYLSVFLLLLLPNGYILSQYSGTIRLLMYLGLSIFVIALGIRRNRMNRFDKLSVVILICVLCNVCYTVLFNDESVQQLLINFALFTTAFLYTVYFGFDEFAKKFIDVMVFLSIFSLGIYFAAVFVPGLLRNLPIVFNVKGLPAYNAFFSTMPVNEYTIRNQSIFWEPGAFQTFINLALIFSLFRFDKNRLRNLLIFLATLFTTFSTAGYISALLISLIFIIHSISRSEKRSERKVLRIAFVLIVVVILALVIYSNLPSNLKYQVFGKLSVYLETGGASSVSIRVDAILVPFEEFLASPIWGKGNLGMADIAIKAGYHMNTATIINWFAMFGIVIGIIMNYGIYRLCRCLETRKPLIVFLFFAFLLLLLSEDYVRNPSILIFAFFGYTNISKNGSSGRTFAQRGLL